MADNLGEGHLCVETVPCAKEKKTEFLRGPSTYEGSRTQSFKQPAHMLLSDWKKLVQKQPHVPK